MSGDRATLAVLSPHPVVVEGFTSMLGRHPDVVEVIAPPRSFDDPEPDIVLYDVAALAEGDGTEFDHLVKETASVIFAVGGDLRPELLSRALNRGAAGFFQLGATESEVLAAVESAMTGWQIGDPGSDPVVGAIGSDRRRHQLGSDVGLSPRETRVLALITQGLSNDQIAARDFLSVNSVKTYIRGAYRKIGVMTRTQAVTWALQHGYGAEPDATSFPGDQLPEG